MKDYNRLILYVEDDEDDSDLMMSVFREVHPDVFMVTAQNGVEALQYLEQVKEKHGNFPHLVILDINMPYMDGRQTFLQMQEDEQLRRIPVIFFTSSENPNDRRELEGWGASMISKPFHPRQLRSIVSKILPAHS